MSIKLSGRFVMQAEMKLHVSRTCFHASLKSQTGSRFHFASHVNVPLDADIDCDNDEEKYFSSVQEHKVSVTFCERNLL